MALYTIDILLESITGLKNGKVKSESLVLVPYEGPAESQTYCETQLKVQSGFLPKKRKYVGFDGLNQIEQVAL